ncbi:MAG: TfoX/Sxy family protein [Armatimonadetes bacterium]|nr:TfoX/Sxy family protein [Armatimonadota bacterium]
MAFDADLHQRCHAHYAGRAGFVEKRMFGGLGWLRDGNMAAGLLGAELIVRVGPADGELALMEPGTRPFDITGRPMKGWVVVAADVLADEVVLADWLDRGWTFAGSLPPK